MFEPILIRKDDIIECMPPESLRKGCREGLYRIDGGVVRTKTGQIKGFLQQTSSRDLLDVAQTFSTVFHVCGIASSVLNLGMSVMTLSKVSRMSKQLESIERSLESIGESFGSIDENLKSTGESLRSIDQKIDLMALDKLMNSVTELKEIERTHMRVFFELEGTAREAEAANIRRDLSRISAVFMNELNKIFKSEKLNAELCVSLIEALGLYQQMYVFTLFATSQFQAIEGFCQREINQVQNFIKVLNSKNLIRAVNSATLNARIDAQYQAGFLSYDYDSIDEGVVQRDALNIYRRKRKDDKITACCESTIRNLESLISLASVLRQGNVSGETYFEELVRCRGMGPVVFLPVPGTGESR